MALTKHKSFAKRIFMYLLASVVLVATVHLLFQYLNLNVYHELNGQIFEISNRVDMDDEASLPTWFSQMLLLSIGISAFAAAFLHRQKGPKRIWSIIGLVGVLMSIDEVAAIHELVLQIIHLAVYGLVTPTTFSNAWLILLPFILLAGVLLLIQAIKYIPRKTIYILTLGAFVLLTGAVFIDILTNAHNANTFYEKGVMVALEETCELLGASIMLFGILDYLESNFGSKIRAARDRLRG
jgi:hypothetical protein